MLNFRDGGSVRSRQNQSAPLALDTKPAAPPANTAKTVAMSEFEVSTEQQRRLEERQARHSRELTREVLRRNYVERLKSERM